ncbi:MAG TPA: hypothetical protein VHY08_17375 [Bacillota bacterium]|nr:hypothetical protein [Bacillota bacterium]
MELLPIEPFHDDIRTCFEDSLVAITRYFRADHELIFARSWGFGFRRAGYGLLGKQVNSQSSRDDCLECLQRYYGIQSIFRREKNAAKLLRFIQKGLSSNRPNITFADAFWIPWEPNYQKAFGIHSLSITGIDFKRRVLSCTDPYREIRAGILPWDHYVSGKIYQCLLFEVTPQYVTDYNWREILTTALERVRGSQNQPDAFSAIREFAEVVNDSLDLKEEVPKGTPFFEAPLCQNIQQILNGRKQFSNLLYLLSQKHDLYSLFIVSNQFKQLSSKWGAVFSLIVKGALKPPSQELNGQIAAKLKELADEEEKVAGALQRLVEIGPSQQSSALTSKLKPVLEKNDEVIYLDLFPLMNNKGFGSFAENDDKADLTGVGEYFLADDVVVGELVIQNMKFRFPKITASQNDNISCNGQIIDVSPGRYFAIMALGCAEFGNYSETLSLEYLNGERETIPLEFSDLWSVNPNFGEIIAAKVGWVNRTADMKCVEKRHIYAQCYFLPCIGILTKLKLPKCPNIHIFAISLCKH